jgi:FixJ family two-component response regulator
MIEGDVSSRSGREKETNQRRIAVPEAPLIAVIDDDSTVREAIRGLLRANGFDVATFASALEFVYSPRFAEVACAIIDVQMPRIDGMELQRRLRQVSPMRVVIITAHPDDRLRQRALAAGAAAFLAKPFSEEELITAIDISAADPRRAAC